MLNLINLHVAVRLNDLSTVQKLKSEGIDIDGKDGSGRTPLHKAAMSTEDDSHLDLAEYLLENGACVNTQDKDGSTPLHYAVKRGNVDFIQLFLNYKADYNAVDNNGYSLLFPAARWNQNVEVVQLLIDLGLNVNDLDKTGKTPLHWACSLRNDNLKNVKLLLKNGAKMNDVDHRGCTPLIKTLRCKLVHIKKKIADKNLNILVLM